MWLRKCLYILSTLAIKLFISDFLLQLLAFASFQDNKPSAENTIKINPEKRQEYFQALSGVYKYNRSEK